ncbi:MAG: DUF1257 domain-containing protein [Cyanobacteria bacterium]|nr:DUF1257 domain-containing protein [Cyanobacteriota bacterium]
MSHLSILPTRLRDVDLLAEALTDLGQEVHRGGAVEGFAGERVPVLLRLDLAPGPLLATQGKPIARKTPQSSSFSLGWARQLDGSLALVGDLGRIAAAGPLQELLSQLSRRYALLQALRDAAGSAFAGAQVTLAASGSTGFGEARAQSQPRS